jgi:hypothetical protein
MVVTSEVLAVQRQKISGLLSVLEIPLPSFVVNPERAGVHLRCNGLETFL